MRKNTGTQRVFCLDAICRLMTLATGFAASFSATGQYCDWQHLDIAGPSLRHSHAMAYDAQRNVTVLFGGLNGGNERTSVLLGDTWEWNGSEWKRVAESGPTARLGAAMVYDTAHGVILLFGGSDGAPQNDTWTWNGIEWKKVASGGPPARSRHSLAYDTDRGVAVLFGGIPRERNDTWEWDGVTWKQAPVTGPTGRSRQAMSYDAKRKVTVLFGGRLADGRPIGDTWEWNGVEWKQVAPDGPMRRSRHSMIYDSTRYRLVVFGGNAGPNLNDTLEWDGADWIRIASGGPVRRMYHAMAYHTATGTILLFGGWDGNAPLADTWARRCTESASGLILLSPQHENRRFQFVVQAATNLSYVVQRSNDLINWVPLSTNSGSFRYVDSTAIDSPWHFYRAVSAP